MEQHDVHIVKTRKKGLVKQQIWSPSLIVTKAVSNVRQQESNDSQHGSRRMDKNIQETNHWNLLLL